MQILELLSCCAAYFELLGDPLTLAANPNNAWLLVLALLRFSITALRLTPHTHRVAASRCWMKSTVHC